MRRIIITATIIVAAATACTPRPLTHDYFDPSDDCPAGEVIVHGDEPTPCDLVAGVNTLTILDITEAECDGDWWYEACTNAGF